MNEHLLSMHDVSADDVVRILDTAESFREVGTRVIKKVPALRGRTVVNLFYENSTRTRISFELAAKRLLADGSTSPWANSASRRERASRTRRSRCRRWAPTRSDPTFVERLAPSADEVGTRSRVERGRRHPRAPDAGAPGHVHDARALRPDEGLRVAIVGDVMHSRVARSLSFGLVKMGADVTLIGPPTLILPDAPAWGVHVSYDIESVLPKLDVTYVLRVQRERQRLEFFPSVREYSRLFGVTNERVAMLPEGALIMHPGPMNRGSNRLHVADLPQSVIEEQVTNGIAVRMSLLYLMLGGAGEGGADE